MLAKKVGELAERPSKFYCLECNRQCFTSGKHQWDCPECGVIRTAREDRCSCEDIDKCEWPGFHKMGVVGEIEI